MATHTFSVRANKDGAEHRVTINYPSYDEATEAMRRSVWSDARANIVVKVQGPLRRRIAKGIRGERLEKEAQAATDAALAGIRRRAANVEPVDAKALGLNKAQVEALRANGVPVVNA